MASASIQDLSLLGLFNRIEHIEQLKEWKKTGEEETAAIASEGAVKKAIAARLEAAAEGFASAEKVKAKEFLSAQLKAVDPSDKHASVRRDKLSQLLQGIDQAPINETPPHVKRGRDSLRRVQQEYKDVHEIYEKWEKGKMMFKTNDELKAMQQKHTDMQKCLEATQSHIAEMLLLTSSDARPPSLPSGGSSASAVRPKAKAGTVRAADPAVRAGGLSRGSGYPAPKSFPVASSDAVRKAALIAELRASDYAEQAVVEAPRAPRPPPRVNKSAAEENDSVVLSYSCTCKAVSELLGLSVDKVRDIADSSSDFKGHLRHDQWLQVKERSLAIEKEQKEAEKAKEQHKKDKALAKISEKQGAPVSSAATALPAANRSAASAAVAAKSGPKAKPAPKTKSASQPKKGGKIALAANSFAGLSDSDDDGFTTVGR